MYMTVDLKVVSSIWNVQNHAGCVLIEIEEDIFVYTFHGIYYLGTIL